MSFPLTTLAPQPAADWAMYNPYLEQFQEGTESDTGKTKRGPGNWNDLEYHNPADTLDADLTTETPLSTVTAETILHGTNPPVSRVEVGTCTGAGTPTSTVDLGGLSGVVGTDITAGTDEFEFAANIETWANTGGNLALSGASSVVDNADGTFTITYPTGANSVVNSTDDPALSFNETTPGTDAETGSVTVEQVYPVQTAYLTTDFPKTDDTLTAVTGWSQDITLEAGKVYKIDVTFYSTYGGSAGSLIDLAGGSAVATAVRGCAFSGDFAADPLSAFTELTALTTDLGAAALPDSGATLATLTIEVLTTGTLIPRFAINIGSGTANNMQKYSTITATEIG